MHTHELALLQDRLEKESTRLRAELSTLGRVNPDKPGDFEATYSDLNPKLGADEIGLEADPNDRADLIEEYETRNSTEEKLEEQYHLVRAALERIKQNTYGVSEVGEPHDIELKRLEANPAATTCMKHMQ